MANQPWLDQVRRQLAENNLPPAYIRRFMEELADHYQDACEDITEENMSMENGVVSRLGEPREVADAAVVAYQQHACFGRHPSAKLLVFGISPVISLLLLFVLACCAVAAIGQIVGYFVAYFGGNLEGSHTPVLGGSIQQAVTAAVMNALTIVIPSVLASIFYCRLAKRLCIGAKWMIVSCAVLAAMVSMSFWYTGYSGIPERPNLLGLGINFPHSLQQLVHLLVPLAIGCWFVRRYRDGGQMQLAS